MTRADLISPSYVGEQRRLHAMPQGYGGKGRKWAASVIQIAKAFDCFSVLDYGCGQGSLARALMDSDPWLSVREYDPAIEGKDGRPSFADLVVCTDVLEHIEPDKLDSVLAHLKGLARKAVFLVVALDPTGKVLSDGRNAHLIQESPAWWRRRITQAGFSIEPYDVETHLTPEKRKKRWVAVVTP